MATKRRRSGGRRPAGVDASGRLKPGYLYLKGGRVVKAKAKKATKRRRR